MRVVPVDFPSFPARFHGQRLASPATGNQCCYVICSRVPPGDQGPKLHVHPADQFYYTLSGTMTLQLGTEQFVIGPDTLVFIPEGTPHRNWNAGDEPEVHLEVIVPAPPEGSPIFTLAEPRTLPDAGRLIRRIDAREVTALGPAGLQIAGQATGSRHAAIRVACTSPGTGETRTHPHAVNQYHYVTSGTLDVEAGAERLRAGPNSLVVLPQGTEHRLWNAGTEHAHFITVTVPGLDGE